MDINSSRGATGAEWKHFALDLGLACDMLPVVNDPEAVPHSNSLIKKFGKVPSEYCGPLSNIARGIAKWQEKPIAPEAWRGWSRDPRLGFCVRTSRLRALDIDVDNWDLSVDIWDLLRHELYTLDDDVACTRRVRSNSVKFLIPFLYEGELKKRIINTEYGRIEILGDGQQFVAAGLHPSGARYEWEHPLTKFTLPRLTDARLNEISALLTEKFGISPKGDKQPISPKGNNSDDHGPLLTEISDADAARLTAALFHAPLMAAASTNDTWSEVGYALLSLGAPGRQMFINWSGQTPGFEPGAPESWWDQHASQLPRTDYRHIFTMARRLGWDCASTLDDFEIDEVPHDQTPVKRETVRLDAGPFTLPPEAATAFRDRTMPEARHLCTDQANANRINAHFGSRLRSVGGKFYGYTGTHWEQSEGEAARCAANLNRIVHEEAKAAREKFDSLSQEHAEETAAVVATKRRDQSKAEDALLALEHGSEIMAALSKAEALEKWEIECEMAPRQGKAIELVRKLVTLDVAKLDRAPHLLTCLNGTLDLRSGSLRGHLSADFITHCAPVNYDAAATCPRFERYLVDILDEDRAAFMQRWLGYCITGETREQKIVLHIGDGANGKGTLIRALKAVLGSYVHTAAPGLFTSSTERHPTEIADLIGRRLVVAQESDDGAVLREGFLKHASGEDEMSARYMYQDFFTFMPTFKLQLLTNHKPVVKGSDFGMWRRLVLIWYMNKYGTQSQIESREATKLIDPELEKTLTAEAPGIFAWLVRGAVQWYASGLQPPDSVVEAREAYRQEQDRVKQFVDECCMVGPDYWTAASGSSGIYPSYTLWCKQSGYHALSLNRFSGELTRVVMGATLQRKSVKSGKGWKVQRGISGLMVNPDDDGGFTLEGNGDLL